MHKHVAIVGAGPSGLAGALLLSKHGVSVTVIDRMSEQAYDRYHRICGAGISEKAFKRLDGIDAWHIINNIECGELLFPGNIEVRMKVRGYVLNRVAFLHELCTRCESYGCRFIRGTVTDVSRDGDGFTVSLRGGERISCTHLMGCDGAHSIVRKRMFGWRPANMFPTTECIVPGEPEPVFRMELGERWMGAYSWTFPAGDDVSIGAMKGLVSKNGAKSHGSRMIPFGCRGPIEDRNVFLCGDAAAMPNPVCAGGLMIGMLSAQTCARYIISDKRGRYQRWWDRNILSSNRFMDFHETILGWKDSDFQDAAEPFKGCRNIYLTGIKALVTKPKYAREYIGCIQTFRHAW